MACISTTNRIVESHGNRMIPYCQRSRAGLRFTGQSLGSPNVSLMSSVAGRILIVGALVGTQRGSPVDVEIIKNRDEAFLVQASNGW